MNKKINILDNILTDSGDELSSRAEELNCLIYKSESKPQDKIEIDKDKKVVQISKKNVLANVWEDKSKIKVRVSVKGNKKLSMKRIAEIAVNAILEELSKED